MAEQLGQDSGSDVRSPSQKTESQIACSVVLNLRMADTQTVFAPTNKHALKCQNNDQDLKSALVHTPFIHLIRKQKKVDLQAGENPFKTGPISTTKPAGEARTVSKSNR